MFTLRPRLNQMLLLLLTLMVLPAVQATCKRVYDGKSVLDANTAQITFGRINLTSTYLQPVGTALGTTITDGSTATGLNSETVMWECDLADKDELYELFATNGDDRVGGYWEIGNGAGTSLNDGLPGYYATYFPYVGIKLTHLNSGKVFTRYWQQSKISQYDVVGDKLQIKPKHLSMVQAELARVSSLPPKSGSGSNYCGSQAAESGSGNYSYTCTQPNGYIQFKGPGYQSDPVGSDSNTNYVFWGAKNGVGFGMRSAASISYTATCVARNVTPLVTFMPVTAQELNNGMTRENEFRIDLECSDQAVSGVASNQTALGIQASATAYAKAAELGLLTGSQGVTHLVSNGYGTDPSVATGVGIALNDNGKSMNFLGSEMAGSGNAGGWYPVQESATANGSSASGYTNYTKTITAVLKALPGQKAMPGSVNATAYVLVKVQ